MLPPSYADIEAAFAVEDVVEPSPERVLVVHPGRLEPDPELRALGEAHLGRLRAANPSMFDGTVMALERIEAGVVHVRRGSYFDMVATCDALDGDAQMRAWALALMRVDGRGDPDGRGDADPPPLHLLRHPAGRVAAVGASLIVVRDGLFTLGLRSDDVALDPGKWHVVPSGVVDERGLRGTLFDELADEHGLGPGALDGARVIALGYDLRRLRPELTLITRDLGALPAPQPSREFVRFRNVSIDDAAAIGDDDLTPAAALAVAALRQS